MLSLALVVASAPLASSFRALRFSCRHCSAPLVRRVKGTNEMVHKIASKAEFAGILKDHERVFVDFYAEWCGPCKRISPKIEKLSQEYPNVKVVKVDVDELSELSEEFGVKAMPTFLLFKNGAKVEEIVGANEDHVVNAIKKLAA